MNFFIDTSSNNITLAKFDAKDIEVINYQANNDVTVSIYRKIKELFQTEDIQDIDKVYVIVGPGSFTALRIGVTIAKAIAHETGSEIYPINILKLQNSVYNKKIAIDARGKKFFAYDGKTFDIIPLDELDKDYLIDPKIDMNKIIEKGVLKQFKKSHHLDVKIEYLKDVI